MDTDEEFANGASDRRYDLLTEQIIGCAYRVANGLGSGFLEKCYENALAHELRKSGLSVTQQMPINVFYDGVVVGQFFSDLIVDGTILVELKAINQLAEIHTAQCINYLAATGHPICLLIYFGRRVAVKRLAGPALRSSS